MLRLRASSQRLRRCWRTWKARARGTPFKSSWESHLGHQQRPTSEIVLLGSFIPDTLVLAPDVFFWLLSLVEHEEERNGGV